METPARFFFGQVPWEISDSLTYLAPTLPNPLPYLYRRLYVHRPENLSEPTESLPISGGVWSLSESVYVGLHQGVHEGFEESEDKPADYCSH